MSWSVVTTGHADQIENRVKVLQPVTNGLEYEPRDEQVNAAKAAALSLIESGAVGTDVSYSVSLSGHANDDHVAPTEPGYSMDTITVSVTQVPAAAVDQFDANVEQAQKAVE
jgi:hypothetical protein